MRLVEPAAQSEVFKVFFFQIREIRGICVRLKKLKLRLSLRLKTMEKKQRVIELVVKIVVAALTAFLTALGTTSCMRLL